MLLLRDLTRLLGLAVVTFAATQAGLLMVLDASLSSDHQQLSRVSSGLRRHLLDGIARPLSWTHRNSENATRLPRPGIDGGFEKDEGEPKDVAGELVFQGQAESEDEEDQEEDEEDEEEKEEDGDERQDDDVSISERKQILEFLRQQESQDGDEEDDGSDFSEDEDASPDDDDEEDDEMNEDDPPYDGSAFGACLMIMDDNHFLVEWLAYNWFVLPLKHLIVFVDDKSRYSPLKIFERWKGYMTIEVVNWTYPGVLAPVPDNLVNQTAVRHYLGNQHKFYEDCVKRFKLEMDWKSWVVLVDTDEYVSINRFTRNPNHPLYAGDDIKLPKMSHKASVMRRIQLITSRQREAGKNVTDCITTPRTQICLKTVNQTRPSRYLEVIGLHDRDFLTQWWVLGDKRKNPKVMVDLGSVPADYVRQLDLLHNGSAHVITPGRECPQKPYYQIYHYAGNQEQRTSKDAIDPRGGYTNRVGGSINPDEDECQMRRVGDIKPWIRGFINEVGQDEARRLLEGSGRVHSWPPFMPIKETIRISSNGEATQ